MISFSLQGDQAVVAMLHGKGPKLAAAIRNSVMRASIMLLAYVKANKLSGQVLKVKTGTLRRKVNYRMTGNATYSTGTVGVKLAYAAAHEFGFDGTENVREHLRTIKQAFGRPIAPVTFPVAAHTRHVHLPERSFLRSSLREMTPEIQAMIAAGVAAGARA